MPIDRELWRSEISETTVPNWPCPQCGIASLSIIKNTFRAEDDGATRRFALECPGDFEPDMATGHFICLLRCEKAGCGEKLAVLGNSRVIGYPEKDGTWEYYTRGRPTSITPPPPMIQIPKGCPKPVRAEVESAFSLFWCDLASSLNRIRNALELVLSDLGIPRSRRDNDKRKMIRLTLHSRIEKLEKKRPKLKDICNRMMAVKHLGNAGSHPGVGVEDGDVFDGFDILERVLEDMYSAHPRELTETVKQIIKRKGPRKKQWGHS